MNERTEGQQHFCTGPFPATSSSSSSCEDDSADGRRSDAALGGDGFPSAEKCSKLCDNVLWEEVFDTWSLTTAVDLFCKNATGRSVPESSECARLHQLLQIVEGIISMNVKHRPRQGWHLSTASPSLAKSHWRKLVMSEGGKSSLPYRYVFRINSSGMERIPKRMPPWI